MILFPFPGQHFSVYNKKASKAGVWWGESWGLHRSPGGCQWPDPAPALLSLCSSRWNHHLLKYSEFLGAVPGCSPARAKDVHGQTRELAGPVSGGFAPLHLLKMLQNGDLGVHWGLLVLDVPPGPKGSGFCSLGVKGVKQPWSCWAGGGQALEHQGLRTVPPCVLFIPVLDDAATLQCHNCLQAEHPKTNPGPLELPTLP